MDTKFFLGNNNNIIIYHPKKHEMYGIEYV